MLASISPLGERARGNRWGLTASAFAAGSILAAAALGALLGLAGSFAGSSTHARLMILGAAAVAAAVVDLVLRSPPSLHRQVDEDWLARYRGWVYGAGFGAQLGVGVVTVVTTATVFAWLVAAAVAGGAGGGAVIGAGFGAARAVPLLLVRKADEPARLRAVLRRLTVLAGPARLGAALASLALAGAAIAAGTRL
jgi:hypothetical protein